MLVDQFGQPMAATPAKVETGFTAASSHHKALALWNPKMWTVDKLTSEKREIEGRIMDVARNNPAVSGAIRSQVDGIVGSKFRLALRPDNKRLGLSRDQYDDWVRQVECEWTAYAENPECWIDARRERTFTDLIRLVQTQELYHGECFASKEWQTSPLGYKTCFQIIDPTRVDCDPKQGTDAFDFGIRRNSFGAPTGYSIKTRRKVTDPVKFRVVPKYNRFGWMQMFHVYDPVRPDQPRGFSRLAAALTTVKQLDRFHETELEQSIIAASYAMYIRSDMPDIDRVFGSQSVTPEYRSLLDARNHHYEGKPIKNNGATIAHLMPGDEIGTVNIGHPTKAFDSFVSANMRIVAKSMGLSYEEFSGDISKVSYASARVALLMTERFNSVKRETIAKRAANLMFRIWLDEAVDRGTVRAPVDYWQNRSQLNASEWISGIGGHVDELKTARAREVNLRTGASTLQEIASQDGYDWEDRFNQRTIEATAKIKALEAAGVNVSEDMKAKIILGELNGSSVDAESVLDGE